MTDRNDTHQAETGESAATEAWREVGQQLEALGTSLASAFRAAWESEENRRHLHELQSGLEAMVDQVHAAIKETADSPEAKRAQIDVEKAAQQTHLALLRAGTELQKLLKDLGSPLSTSSEPGEQEETD